MVTKTKFKKEKIKVALTLLGEKTIKGKRLEEKFIDEMAFALAFIARNLTK